MVYSVSKNTNLFISDNKLMLFGLCLCKAFEKNILGYF